MVKTYFYTQNSSFSSDTFSNVGMHNYPLNIRSHEKYGALFFSTLYFPKILHNFPFNITVYLNFFKILLAAN